MSNALKTGTLEAERIIGYNIARIMKEKKLAEEELSSHIPIPKMRIKAILTGSVDIQEEELLLFAKELDVNEQELLQSVPDKDLYHHNIHYMGTAEPKDMKKIIDKADMYVRLLNVQSDR